MLDKCVLNYKLNPLLLLIPTLFPLTKELVKLSPKKDNYLPKLLKPLSLKLFNKKAKFLKDVSKLLLVEQLLFTFRLKNTSN